MTGTALDDRWCAAVRNLCFGTLRLTDTAKELSRPIKGEHLFLEQNELPKRLATHIATFADYTVALACVQALLAEANIEANPSTRNEVEPYP